MAMYRLCTVCKCKVEYGKRCECEINKRKESYREYKRNRNDKDEQKFYSSKVWIDCRDVCVRNFYGLDIIELLVHRRVVAGEIVHHIVETKEDWTKRLDIDNLIYLTKENHNRIHSMYSKSKKDKEIMQKSLRELIEIFNSEYR